MALLHWKYLKKFQRKRRFDPLKAPNRKKDIIKRIIDINLTDEDLNVSVKSIMYGEFSAGTRAELSKS